MPDRIFKWIVTSTAWAFIALVVGLAVILAWESWPALQAMGGSFFWTSTWDPVASLYGILPMIYGTLVSSALALLIAAPVGIGIAVFLSELAPAWMRGPVGFLVELLAAIPSVILGLWGILYLAPLMREHVEPWVIDRVGDFPLFQGPPYGVGMATAGLILAIMVVPIISSISRDVLRAVPREQREAAVALGATRWEVIWHAVLGNARSGITGAIFLGLGRALGETMAVTMVIGNRPDISASLFAPAHTLASVIANEFTEATSDLYLSALMAVGFTLLVVTLIVNGLARLLVFRTARLTG